MAERPRQSWFEELVQEAHRNAGRGRNLTRYLTGNLKTPALGGTPNGVRLQVGRTRLLEYGQPAGGGHQTPLLFVPSLVNRHYILDLIPERSVIAFARSRGHHPWCVDWGVPGIGDRDLGLADYLERLRLAAERVAQLTGEVPTLVGYCMGGSLAMIHAANHPELIRNLVLLATPIDFAAAGLLRLWAQPDHFDLDRFVGANGLVPPDLLNQAFTLLKPTWQARNLRALWSYGWNDDFLRSYLAISAWVNDPVPVAGRAFRDYVQDFYRDNRTMDGSLTCGGRRVDFARFSGPLLNVVARNDHIVPPASSLVAPRLFSGSSLAENLELPVGHIGLSVGEGAFELVWQQILKWLQDKSS